MKFFFEINLYDDKVSKIVLLFSFLLIIGTGCDIARENKSSYWASQKEKFIYQDLKEFISDSLLAVSIKSCNKVRHKSIDSLFPSKKVYLYSWQNGASSERNEFTVVKDDDELGLKIFYLIFDKKDNLISMINLANAGNEGGYIFETKSKFLSKDSILQINSITQWVDLEKQKKMETPIGDSTFLYVVIKNNGKIFEQKIKEVKNLNFTN